MLGRINVYAVEPAVMSDWGSFRYIDESCRPGTGRQIAAFPQSWRKAVLAAIGHGRAVYRQRITEKLKAISKCLYQGTGYPQTLPPDSWLREAEQHGDVDFWAAIIATENPREHCQVVFVDHLDADRPPWQTSPLPDWTWTSRLDGLSQSWLTKAANALTRTPDNREAVAVYLAKVVELELEIQLFSVLRQHFCPPMPEARPLHRRGAEHKHPLEQAWRYFHPTHGIRSDHITLGGMFCALRAAMENRDTIGRSIRRSIDSFCQAHASTLLHADTLRALDILTRIRNDASHLKDLTDNDLRQLISTVIKNGGPGPILVGIGIRSP